MDLIDNRSITSNKLNKGGFHLNPRVLGKLTINFIRRTKKFATTWRITCSFRKASSFDPQINFKCLTNLGNTEKSDESVIGPVTKMKIMSDGHFDKENSNIFCFESNALH